LKAFPAFDRGLEALDPDHRAIVRGMAWLALFVLLGKLSGAVKEMTVAYRYGIGAEVDGYLFVLNLVSWPLALWFGVLTMVLVPLAARMREQGLQELSRFRAELFGAALIVGLLLAVVAAVVLPILIASPRVGLSPATAGMAAEAGRGMVLLLPLGVLSSLFSVWILAAGGHANTLLEGVPALAIAAAVLLSGGGVAPLVWGTVAGFALHLACLALSLARRGEISRPRLGASSPAWRWFWQSFAIMLAGNAVMSLIDIVDLMFAVHLGTGAVSTLGYANRLLALMMGLGGTAVSRATLPVFARAHHDSDGRIHALAMRWVAIMLAVGALAALAVWWLAPLAVRLVFERGAFDAANTAAVAGVLRYGALQMPFFFAALVLVSSLVARGLHRAVALGAAVNLLVKVGASLLLVPAFGMRGIVLSTCAMYLGSLAMLFFYARHGHKDYQHRAPS
jgi:putative peptidoglycan lipid II flippase